MDQRDFLSENSTRCILVFFENTMNNFTREPSFSRRSWFENFREYLNFSPIKFCNSKKRMGLSEEIVFAHLKYLKPSVKTWLLECALEMISSDENFDLSDVKITATRISKALDIPESDFYDIMESQTVAFKMRSSTQNKNLDAVKSIYYSRYKTKGLLYSIGEYIFTLYPEDTVSLSTPDNKLHFYTIESLYEDRNDRVFIIQSHDSGQIGEFRLKVLGLAELSFGGKVILKLKI